MTVLDIKWQNEAIDRKRLTPRQPMTIPALLRHHLHPHPAHAHLNRKDENRAENLSPLVGHEIRTGEKPTHAALLAHARGKFPVEDRNHHEKIDLKNVRREAVLELAALLAHGNENNLRK